MFDFDSNRAFLAEQLHLTLLSKEEQDEVLRWLNESMSAEINKNISEMLGEEDKEKYDRLQEIGEKDPIYAFLYEKIPNIAIISDMIAQSILKKYGVKFEEGEK